MHMMLAGLFISLSAASGFAADMSPPTSTSVSMVFHLVVDCKAKDASAPMRVEKTPRTVCLKEQAIVDQNDIRRAEVVKISSTRVGVKLILTDKAAQQLLETTRNSIGQQLGLIVNDRLVAVPIIVQPVSNEFIVDGQFTQEEANNVVQALNRRATAN